MLVELLEYQRLILQLSMKGQNHEKEISILFAMLHLFIKRMLAEKYTRNCNEYIRLFSKNVHGCLGDWTKNR